MSANRFYSGAQGRLASQLPCVIWAKNLNMAEVDYIIPNNPDIIPVEVKSGTQGGMKSLWLFMREKQVRRAVRCSLENFGQFDYVDRHF